MKSICLSAADLPPGRGVLGPVWLDDAESTKTAEASVRRYPRLKLNLQQRSQEELIEMAERIVAAVLRRTRPRFPRPTRPKSASASGVARRCAKHRRFSI